MGNEPSAGGLAASFIALCGSARSFLGHSGGAFKCILNEGTKAASGQDVVGEKAPSSASSASRLVADVRSFLLEIETDPTSADILLEALDGQVRQESKFLSCSSDGACCMTGLDQAHACSLTSNA